MDYKKLFRCLPLLGLAALAFFTAFQTHGQTFGVYRQLWTGLSTTDGSVNALTNTLLNPNWPNNPNAAYTQVFTNFETETNLLDGYGQRLRGFVVPPTNGFYTFWIASGDNSSLFLSADENSTNRQLLCYVSSATNPRQWTKEPNQMSAPVFLEAGRRSYIEAVQKDASGGDNLAVRWQLPNGVIEEPLTAMSAAGTLLIPFNNTTNILPGIYSQPTNVTVAELGSATFSLLVTNWGSVTYQWRTNGVNLPTNFLRKPFLTVSNVTVAAHNGLAYDCVVSNASGTVTSLVATLTVVADTNPPTLSSASSPGQTTIAVAFSKLVEAVSATNGVNYTISGGLSVSGASLADAQTVWLTISPGVVYGSNYTVTVNTVRDRATTPNTIAPNSQISFTALAYNPALVGGALPAGSVTVLTNGFDLTGAGSDIGGTADQFQFDYQLLTGNFDMRVRVQGLAKADVWAKAGLMARDNLTPGSRFASAIATPTVAGEFFEYRAAVGGAPTIAGGFPPNYPSTWLRLQRAGNQFTGYASYDGQTWTVLGTANLTLSNTVYFGMAVASRINGQTALAQFRDLGPTPPSAVVGVVANPNEPLAACSRKTALVISEIMYKPAPNTNGLNLEYIELYNANPYFFDMSGWRLTGDMINYTFPTPMIIQGGAFVVIAAAPADVQAAYGLSGVLGPYTGSLKKSGLVQLVDEVGAVRLEIPYSNIYPWPVAAEGAGHSIVLARPSYGEADPHAWDISDVVGGSPGRAEAFRPGPLRNVVINELLAHTEDPNLQDYVELYNHGTQTVDLSGCVLTDDANTNKYVVPAGTMIGPGNFAVFDQAALGFALNASGETLFFKNPDCSRVLDAVAFEAQADGVSLGRWPDGGVGFYPMSARTPGAHNSSILVRDIVINELMYSPISGDDNDQFIELYNKGASAVNLGGWQLTAAVTFTFPSNTWVNPDGYLVVARSMTNLLAKYPNLNAGNTVGDYNGKMSHIGERVALAMPQALRQTNHLGQLVTNTIFVVEDEVTFGTGGRWGQWSSGGGSSLELIDPRSNHRLAANWADSDESSKAPWVNIEHTGVLDNGAGGGAFMQIGLLDVGECLVDNIEVHAGAGPNLVLNPGFEIGPTNWWMEGCFVRSTVESNSVGFTSQSALHLRCSDRIWTGANSAEGKMSSAPAVGSVATLRFKARWLHGWPEALMRLDGNYLEATGPLVVPSNLGTPGQRNSRAAANNAPAIYQVTHTPAVPAVSNSVVVTARVHDPDGVQTLRLLYRVDPSLNYTAVPMNDSGVGGDAIAGDGLFSATIPGQAVNVLVAFYIAATDTLGASNTFPAVLNEFGSIHECVVMFGDTVPTSTFGTYHMWISATNVNRWASMPNLGNEVNDATFVYNNRVIYNTAGRFAGSPYHQNFNTPSGSLCHYKWVFPDDDKLFGATSFNKIHDPGNGAGDDPSIQREQLSHTFMRAVGVPWLNRKYVNMFVNGVRRGTAGRELMEDAQTPDGDVVKEYWPNDSGGFLYKMQPWFEFNEPATGPNIGNNNQSWCNVMPYTTTGGAKKLARYRWNFLTRRTPDSANNYTNVFTLVDAASSSASPNYTAAMNNIADMENWMRVAAATHASGDWDAFMSGNSQNVYGYIGTKGTRYSLLMWDYNIVIGNPGTVSWAPGANLFVFNENGQDSNAGNIINNPTFRRAYFRALQELVYGPLEVSKSGPQMDAKYAAFKANGFTTVEDPNNCPSCAQNNMKVWLAQAQASIATSIAAENTTTFTVTANSISTSSNSVTIKGTAPVQVMSLTVNGENWPVTWTSVTGWTLTLPVGAGTSSLVVKGYDRFGNFISGTSNLVTVTSTPPPPDSPIGKVVINEIMFNPLTPDTEFVELYNASTNTTFDLSGWVLNGVGYTFPPGSSIAPGRFLVLAQNRAAFAGAYGATTLVFDTFSGNLQDNGETLTLIQPGLPDVIIDKVKYQSTAPWPTGSNGVVTASSLEVIDPLQDNSRAGNWATRYIPAVYSPATNLPVVVHPPVTNNAGWHFVSTTTTNLSGTTNLVLLFLDAAGRIYIDDLSLVDGTNAGVGPNFLGQGDFEVAALDPNLWQMSSDYSSSVLSTDFAHSGTNSLLIISTQNTPGGSYVPLRGIQQTLASAPTNGEVCTLSFWYYPASLETNCTARLSSTLRASAYVALNITPGFTDGGYYQPPQVISPPLVVATPGRANSALVSLPPFPPLWINELQADNLSGITNSAGQHTPWVELYNAGTNSVSLTGLYLANDYTNLTRWAFPAGASINPGEFKVVFCDGQTGLSTLTELHTSFLLTSSTGSVALSRLFNWQPQVLDFVDYSGVKPDRSYGDFPDGQPFARQEFFFVTPGGTNNNAVAPVHVFVNEWMSANASTIADPADNNAFDDWFELYNVGPTPADLTGYYLANNTTNKFLFQIPAGYVIPSGGFLLVWADKKNGAVSADLHTNFKLSKSGASIGLYTPNGATVDFVSYPAQASDVASGRCPDGDPQMRVLPLPSPRAANYCNNWPVLQPITDRALYLGQTLSFNASATDADAGQSLIYSLVAGAPAGTSIDPVSGLFQWTPSATSFSQITVRVTDNGVPALSDSKSFTVMVILPPKAAIGPPSGGSISLTFPTLAGKNYKLQYKDSLNPSVPWTDLPNSLTAGTGGNVTVSDSIASNPDHSRFYRIVPVN